MRGRSSGRSSVVRELDPAIGTGEEDPELVPTAGSERPGTDGRVPTAGQESDHRIPPCTRCTPLLPCTPLYTPWVHPCWRCTRAGAAVYGRAASQKGSYRQGDHVNLRKGLPGDVSDRLSTGRFKLLQT